MPTRRQRRRRDKSLRHEYETVLIDEEGNETLLDADEERSAREERDKQRAETRAKAKKPAGKPARAMREPPPPSWQRAIKRGGIMGALIFVLFMFVLKGGTTVDRVAIPAFYAVAFIPLTYMVDRWSYRMYQKRMAKKQ